MTAPDPNSTIASATLGTLPPSSPPPVSTPISAPHKEAGPISEPNPIQSEAAPLVEIQEKELPPEVEGWLQKLDSEGDIKLDQPITHDGEVLLADTEAQVVKDRLVLPLSQSGVQSNLKARVTDSARWLAEWCVRLLKLMKDKVRYAEEPYGKT